MKKGREFISQKESLLPATDHIIPIFGINFASAYNFFLQNAF